MQRTRAEHRKRDGNAVCRRCGLFLTMNAGRCPPGFWMTKAEAAAWDAANSIYEQREMEHRLGAQARKERTR